MCRWIKPLGRYSSQKLIAAINKQDNARTRNYMSPFNLLEQYCFATCRFFDLGLLHGDNVHVIEPMN
jgi:hypothetical protein